MSFALSAKAIPNIRSYVDACNWWRDAKPWRGQTGEYDYRPLSPTRKDHLKIHKGHHDEIRLRYHYTDCVIYWPDGCVSIEAYSSQSTNTFVRELAPHGFEPDFIKAHTMIWVPMLWEGGKAVVKTGLRVPYRSNVWKFRPVRDRPTYPLHWELHPDSDHPQSFTRRTLNRKEAKAALRDTNYYDFVPWANAVRSMLKKPKGERRPFERGDYEYNADQLVDLLQQGISGWMAILEDRGSNCQAHVRDAIYRTTTRPIIIEEEVPCIQGYANYESFIGNSHKLDNY